MINIIISVRRQKRVSYAKFNAFIDRFLALYNEIFKFISNEFPHIIVLYKMSNNYSIIIVVKFVTSKLTIL